MNRDTETGFEGLATVPEPVPVRRSSEPAPRLLWLAATAVVIPVLVPMVFLVGRVFGATEAAWDTLFAVRTLELTLRTVGFTVAVTTAAVVIGTGAAWLVARTDLPGARWWNVAVSLPLVIPSYVIALALLSAFGPRGLVAEATGWAVPSAAGFWGAWTALTIATYPYVYLVAVTALRRLDPALEEAARGLGAGPWRTFRTVVLPQLRPAVAAGALLAALYTLSDFGAVSLLRFDAFTRVIYAQYQGRLDRTPAAVLSLVLILLALVIVAGERRTRAGLYGSRPARPAPRVRLGAPAATGALAGLGVLALAGLGLPLGVLAAWLQRGGDPAVAWGSLAGSVAGSAAAAFLAALASLPIVLLVVRYRSRAAGWLDRAVYGVFALPHITVGLAVVVFAANHLGPLYQSFVLLAVVYATVFLAQATGPVRAALLQIDPRLEEAARSLGRSRGRAFRDITLRLIGPGVLAGAALVFLTTMKELPITLLLRPTGFDTLAVDIWTRSSELAYGDAALPAMILLAVASVPLYLLGAGNPAHD